MQILLVLALAFLSGTAGFLGYRFGNDLIGDVSGESGLVIAAAIQVLTCLLVGMRYGWSVASRVLGLILALPGTTALVACLYFGPLLWSGRTTIEGGWLLLLFGPGIVLVAIIGLIAVVTGVLLLFLPLLFRRTPASAA